MNAHEDALMDELNAAVEQLSLLMLSEESLGATLQRVVDVAVHLLPGCSAAGVTLLSHGRFSTAAYTTPWMLDVDRGQYDADAGPCVDAARTGRFVHAALADLAQDYPDFVGAATRNGVLSILAGPLQTVGESFGALNLYSDQVDGFGPADLPVVAMFTAQASVALANSGILAASRQLVAQLQEALASRSVIERAKGFLMAVRGVDADAAFGLLREQSQRSNVKLHAVAAAVLAEGSTERAST